MLELIRRLPGGETDARPLLFIHGAWHGAWCWDEYMLPYVAEQGIPAYAVSLRGHGASLNDKVMALTTVGDYITDVAWAMAQVTAERGQPPVLVGHSMGGYVVQKALERYDVPGAVLMASIPVMGVLPLLLRLTRDYTLTTITALSMLHLYQYVKQVERVHTMFFSPSVPRDDVERWQSQMVNESLGVILQATLLDLPRPKRINPTPLLVLGAANDAIFTVGEVEATAQAYGTTAHIIPEMAHDMMLEPGWQAVADHVVMWSRAL
jgi:hypothetical protein